MFSSGSKTTPWTGSNGLTVSFLVLHSDTDDFMLAPWLARRTAMAAGGRARGNRATWTTREMATLDLMRALGFRDNSKSVNSFFELHPALRINRSTPAVMLQFKTILK